jgi:hypothetical protein
MISIAWKKQLCKLIQSLDTGNFAAVKLYLGICHFHPGLLHQNMAFHSMPVNFAMLKFFRVRFGDKPKNWLFPKTLRLRKKYVRNSRLMAKCDQKNGLSTVAIF